MNTLEIEIRRIFAVILLVLTVLVLSNCSLGLGTSLKVNKIIPGEQESILSSNISQKIFVQNFEDQRTIKAIGRMEGQNLLPNGSIEASVRSAFEKELQKRGAALDTTDAFTVTGKITKWFVEVEPSFPSAEANSDACIEIELYNPEKEIVFTGIYSGNAIVKHPLMSEDRIEHTLGSSMYYAIEEALNDHRFISALRNYS